MSGVVIEEFVRIKPKMDLWAILVYIKNKRDKNFIAKMSHNEF